ncbi:hypothetical protein BHM03_00023432 [Ensete ventricosum]|nr:hypothetical protein BHM03_00023432 [Ensete ventricosum]
MLFDWQRCSIDDDEHPSFKRRADEMGVDSTTAARDEAAVAEALQESSEQESSGSEETMGGEKASELGERLPCTWTSAAGARIGCVRDYPTDLQSKALEKVNLSPRVAVSPGGHRAPVPSPRPSPKVRLSPRLQYMGIPSPTVSLTLPNNRRRC